MTLLKSGDRCWMTTNAIPVCHGMGPKGRSRDSRPPAEAAIPTMGNAGHSAWDNAGGVLSGLEIEVVSAELGMGASGIDTRISPGKLALSGRSADCVPHPKPGQAAGFCEALLCPFEAEMRAYVWPCTTATGSRRPACGVRTRLLLARSRDR